MGKKKNKRVDKNFEKEFKIKFTKRAVLLSVGTFILLVLLMVRIAWIQFVDGASYKELAYKQQTIDKEISPKRGTIYDASGTKALATSASVDTVSINPTLIKDANKETVAHAMADIFDLDYTTVYEKVCSNTAYQSIIKKVESEKINQFKKWMSDNKISRGINIDSDSKRYYPYDNLASNLIGFCGTDNTGRAGLEYKWDSVLTGTPGRLITSKNNKSQEIPDANERYIPATNGSDIILSIDYNLQSIAEKYLKQAVNELNCTRGGNVIMMQPSTGDILAMATYPDYNLNTPSMPFTESQMQAYEALETTEEKNKFLNSMWRNKAVSDTYEPGSTFKILTATIGLEEGLVETDTPGDFNCKGFQTIYDTDIRCWRWYSPHGPQSLREALENSCNPAFMQLGARIGTRTLYKYYKAFGLFDKTGASVAGESNSIFYPESEVGPADLATMSFGQRFTITPLQLITAVSAIANDGVLMQPRIVKQIVNTDTGAVTNIEPVQVRQVISKKTANTVKDLLLSVVKEGTGGHAAVTGYSVGGKTGTSEPIYSRDQDGYTASYIAISPIENTQVVVLVTLYGITGKNHNGGQVAGPVVKQILTEALPALGIPSNNAINRTLKDDSTVMLTDVTKKTMAEAESTLNSAGFRVVCKTSGNKDEAIVTSQVPKSGTRLVRDSIVFLYDNSGVSPTMVTVPNLKGLSAGEATNVLKSRNLNISIEGSGKVIAQSPTYDTSVQEGSIVSVLLDRELTDTY